MAVLELVGEAAQHDATDDRRRRAVRWIEDRLIGGRALDPPRRQLALHRTDDVATLTRSAQRVLDAVRKPPSPPRRGFQPGRADPASANGRRAATAGTGRGSLAPTMRFSSMLADQSAVDRGQPLGGAVLAQPRLDFEVGARTEIERRQPRRAFANAMRDIFARDDQSSGRDRRARAA